MSRTKLMLLVITLGALVVAVGLNGCGGTDEAGMYFNVSERASWSPGGRFAFASFGGSGLLYIYNVNEGGGAVVLLTLSDNDKDLADEGGWHPAHNSDGSLIAFASRRGPSPGIWVMDGVVGDRAQLRLLTDDTDLGADEQPSWRPDGNAVIYTSTRNNNNCDIRVINADGSGMQDVVATDANEQWPNYNPQNPDQITFQSDESNPGGDDTDIFTYTIPSATYQKLADSSYVDGAPAWNPDGTKIAFHSNRGGDYDIWMVDVTSGTLTRVTNDARSDGFPIWNPDGSRLAFTRDRELWSVAADGSDERRVTRRF